MTIDIGWAVFFLYVTGLLSCMATLDGGTQEGFELADLPDAMLWPWHVVCMIVRAMFRWDDGDYEP